MAPVKKRVAPKKTGGPYLASAVFCENVVEGADRSMSAIRIIDQVTVAIPADAPQDVPSESKRIPVSTWILVIFKTGYGKRKHAIEFAIHSPSGKRESVGKQDIVFSEQPHGGANLKINLNVMVSKGGLFWVDVILDGKLVTRMPISITVERGKAPDAPKKKFVITRKPA